jgi:uncharacterized protein (TIGR02145 family)
MSRSSINYPVIIIVLFGFTLLQNVAFSQSKKQQIVSLNSRIDSIKQLIQTQQIIKNSEIQSLESKNSFTQRKIDSLIYESKTIENLLISERKDKQNKELEIRKIKNVIDKQNDSIRKYSNLITIGKQIWCTKDLDVSTFSNGDVIPEAKSDAEWSIAGKKQKPAWCYVEKDGIKYCKLYNGWAVNDARGLAPLGYKIAKSEDWSIIRDLTCQNNESEYNCDQLRSRSGWEESNANGSDLLNLELKPYSGRSCNGYFGGVGWFGYWYCSDGGYEMISFDNHDRLWDSFGDSNCNSSFGFPVRCIKINQ